MMPSLHHQATGDGCCYYSDVDDSSSSSGDSFNLNYHITKDNVSVTATGQKTTKRSKKKKKVSKSQHSLDSLRQRVSHLMRIFEEQGWFVPMPDSNNSRSISDQQQINNTKKSGAGKVWSNRNYGADKKRQRKQSERVMLESRILQLEMVLKDEHGVVNPD
jgi:hypothetical protein